MHRLSGRRPLRGFLTGLGLAALFVASAGPTAVAGSRQEDGLLQQRTAAILDTGVVGVSAEVTAPRWRARARAGTAEIGTGRPVPSEGRFRTGSVTKTFTATVVLQLVGEGRMSLEDTVERWLPGLVRGDGVDGQRITVRQLLQHTSGIPDVPRPAALRSAAGYRAERFRTYTPVELVQAALRQPGSRDAAGDHAWSYSNTNYVLAAMIVHAVTGRSWGQEVDDRIIRPLRLRGTSVPGTLPFVRGPHAHGYAGFGTTTATDVTVLDPSMAVGSGSIISTNRDLGRFYAALLGGRLLAAEQLTEMRTTVPAPGIGGSYGLGLGELPLTSCGGSYFGHVGELLGYHAWVGATRDGSRTAAVYVTGDGGAATQQRMIDLVERHLCGAGS
ncbi:serine hydrolase domain-containing protein [Streptomyces sp. MMBL 11-3]|uniref:serine hydrolase domain-containing protein n=1 Tax=Streptomyces sp. MMBL 11-3 TaxID=3382639 RepID=UPI0039B56A55